MKSAVELKTVATGRMADVRLAKKAFDAYGELQKGRSERDVKRRRQLQRFFQEFCENEPHRLNDQQYKKEGNFSDGRGGKVAVWAFKPLQWRLYGAILKVGGKKCFVGVELDPEKKQEKADKRLLEATAVAISEFEEYST